MGIFGEIGDAIEGVVGGIAGGIGKAAKGIVGFLGKAVGDGLENLADDVKKIQQHLKNLGHFDDEPNGILSKDLDKAIKAFQSENDLKVDGKLLPGGETERTLYEKLTGRDPTKSGSKRTMGAPSASARRTQTLRIKAFWTRLAAP